MGDNEMNLRPSNFESDNHALYAGWVLGVVLKYDLDAIPGVDNDGNYTDRIIIEFPEGAITLVIPPPPEDWSLT